MAAIAGIKLIYITGIIPWLGSLLAFADIMGHEE
jgi:hypothetical protein